jgi:hypothetical protein
MFLVRTIISVVKPSVIYGRAGDEVRVIVWHNDVAIVEDKEGGRFSVKKEHLSETAQSVPDTTDEIINRPPVSMRQNKNRKEVATNTLF